MAVCLSVFGQIVVYAEAVFALGMKYSVSRLWNTPVWSQVLERSPIGSRSGDDDGIGHSAVFFQVRTTRQRSTISTDGDVDADDACIFDSKMHGDGRLAGTAVTDDEFTLATADRNHESIALRPAVWRAP